VHLVSANLGFAQLDFVRLAGADLTRANVTYAKWPNNIRVPEGWLVDKAPGPLSGRLKREDQLSAERG
jgi:hypothetical protein